MDRQKRIDQLRNLLSRNILVLDGAMGTAIQDLDLNAQDFGGAKLEGCNENLVLTRPKKVAAVHQRYLEAGADIIETNTFGATPIVLAEYDLQDQTHEINVRAAQIAREQADAFSEQGKQRFVAGSIGPTTKSLSVTGGTTFSELTENFYAQAKALYEGGVDYFLLETCQDSLNIKAALCGIDRLHREVKTSLPVAISGTIEPTGTMLGGQTAEALVASFAHRNLLYMGLNCATGPEFMTDHIRVIAELAPFPIACVPNAGLPDEDGKYLETPRMLADILKRFLEKGWINLVGGCCGTTPEHISALAKLVHEQPPRTIEHKTRSFLSGVDYLEITDEMRPVIVGERTNVIGSRKFKRLVCEGKWEESAEVARAQVKAGAQIIDVCLANPDRDELEDIRNFMGQAAKMLRAPIMIDSTDAKVIEDALTYCQGKAIINSINLEDGEERFETVLPLAKKFGAALVVGTIDDDPQEGMATTRERKLEVAKRSHKLLTQKYQIADEDIYWDPLVFPCATGDEKYVGSAVETIEGIRLIKEAFPRTKTVLGISNVSFGLPPAGREVLNSVFLYHCVEAGLDLAIVNSQKLERYASLSDKEKELSVNLLWNRTEDGDPVALFTDHFREKKPIKTNKSKLPLNERLASYILEGTRDGLVNDLNEALKKSKPLNIINGPLMSGMDEVGKLFNENKLIVAEVLQSAESMKAAVAHLESFMEKSEASLRGTVVLATVKGDVHDIGKNLVEIILGNNGFKIINLGIKVPPEQLIAAAREHQPNIIGLSGLLVKSCQQMVITAEDFTKAGIETPILVGGAALSKNFVHKRIGPAYHSFVTYAKDAMDGLELAKRIVDDTLFETLKQETHKDRLKSAEINTSQKKTLRKEIYRRSSKIEILKDIPQPPDFERHIVKKRAIETIWKFINPMMLYSRHLGVKGKTAKLLSQLDEMQDGSASFSQLWKEIEKLDPKSLSIWQAVTQVKQKYKNTPFMQPSGIYSFFRAASQDNNLSLFAGDNGTSRKLIEFQFPRQQKTDGLCLTDYVSPLSSSAPVDNIALFATTVGIGVREEANRLKDAGEYLESHILQALAIESAEAYAELLHSQLRMAWGLADLPEMTMMQRFQAKYKGKRYSFGYPACPKLDDQALLWKVLRPQDIGIQLTEGFMMDPEASVSAIAFHHPQATYFSVGSTLENMGEELNRI